MRPQSSVRQSKKVSNDNQKISLPPEIDFNRKRLVNELLCLGNPKINLSVAESISFEVEKELEEREPSHLNSEIVSEVVRFKLEEMGLIEIKPHKERIKKNPTEKAGKVTHPFMPHRIPVRLALKTNVIQIEKEKLQWSEEGKKTFKLAPEWLGLGPKSFEDPSTFLNEMSQAVGEIDSNFEGFHDYNLIATQFYNRMACLDFIPGSIIFKTNFKSGTFFSPATSLSVLPKSEEVYETLQRFSKDSSVTNTTLGIQLKNSPEIENGALLLLKLLKTSLEYRFQTDQNQTRQDLFLSFADLAPKEEINLFGLTDENDTEKFSSPFSSLFQWIEEEENRKYFSLSLGVPGRTLPCLPAPESFEQNLVRILHQHLLVNASVRLYFLERCLDAMTTSQEIADRSPTPQSPGLYSPGEIVPSLFLNLAVMVRDEEIDWDRLRRAVRQAVHFLDNMIDLWSYPNPESEKITKSNRNIALGVMGLADLLFTLRIPYNSQEALDLEAKLADFIADEATKASSELAKTRGVFPNYIGSKWQEKGLAVRNAQICSLQWDPLPSLIAQTSTGIEPHSKLVELEGYEGEKPKYLIHPFLAETARKRGFFNDKILARVVELGSLNVVSEIPDDIRKVFVSHSDINLHWHLLTASMFEKHFDYGVVKVCPLSIHSDSYENLQNILDQARELGLKSLWIKREGEVITPAAEEIFISEHALSPLEEIPDELPQPSPLEELESNFQDTASDESDLEISQERIEEDFVNPISLESNFQEDDFTQLLPVDEMASEVSFETSPEKTPEAQSYIQPRIRPDFLQGSTRKYASCCGDLFVTLNQDDKGPYEVLAQLGKTFGNETSLLEVISKLISLAIQSGVHPQSIHEQLHGTICLRHLNTSHANTSSPVEMLAREIEKLIPQNEVTKELEEDKTEVISVKALVC